MSFKRIVGSSTVCWFLGMTIFIKKVVTKSLGVSWLFSNILSHQGWTSYNSIWGRTLEIWQNFGNPTDLYLYMKGSKTWHSFWCWPWSRFFWLESSRSRGSKRILAQYHQGPSINPVDKFLEFLTPPPFLHTFT